ERHFQKKAKARSTSPSHSQTPHTPSTSSSQVNSQVTPNTSTQSYYQSDNDSTQVINSPSYFDHTPLRGFRTLSDLYENTEELLLAEDKPKNYKEASSDQKWIEAMKAELDSINRNNTWELTTLPKGHKAIGLKWVFKTKKDANGNIIKHKARLVAKGYIQEHGIDFEEVFVPTSITEETRYMDSATVATEIHRSNYSSNTSIMVKETAKQAYTFSRRESYNTGGHTVGVSHCPVIVNRLYNFTGKGDSDPSLDPKYIPQLKSICSPTDTTIALAMDRTPRSFDEDYYTVVLRKRGLFQSDAALLNDKQTSAYVKLQSKSFGYTFFNDFSKSMVKMGKIGVLTGSAGEIRRTCALVN
ncbi:ribonuclease H-like domain, reverse transcriptase, RNA-dependent DNA polymerase, partial [Tanacetum coccineum]